MNKNYWCRFLIVGCLLCLPHFALAEDKSAASKADASAPKNDEPVFHIYNLNYLIQSLPYYALPPRVTSTPSTEPSDDQTGNGLSQDEINTSIEKYIHLIENNVEPESWKDNGGTTGTIQSFDQSLAIFQTPAAHEKIKKFLDAVRADQDRGGVFNIRAYWLNLTPEEVASIYAARKSSASLPIVSDELLSSRLYCAAQTTCYSGQTVHVVSGKSVSYVSAVEPVFGDDAVAYQPTMSNAVGGVRLQLLPQLTPEGDKVMMDIQSIVSEVSVTEPDKAAAPATDQATLRPDLVSTSSQQFRTTARLPFAQNILVGGMALDVAKDAQPARQIYLVFNVEAVK